MASKRFFTPTELGFNALNIATINTDFTGSKIYVEPFDYFFLMVSYSGNVTQSVQGLVELYDTIPPANSAPVTIGLSSVASPFATGGATTIAYSWGKGGGRFANVDASPNGQLATNLYPCRAITFRVHTGAAAAGTCTMRLFAKGD